jgi:hypothetical protein
MTDAAFVERRFENEGRPLVCRFMQPTLQPGGEYQCRWSIDWGEGERTRRAAGIDSIQALLVAMRTAHTELVESDAYKEGKLTYLNERDLDLPPSWVFDD